ncbi:hypothetical protein VNO78_30558 [Psophocarpus tetragonolobus]|uniref:Uncharacterized protein n=1 Tax=Psophocarpus tetragonolobus TaxID=3891 RepID=A0AAN9X5J2_PSOTE
MIKSDLSTYVRRSLFRMRSLLSGVRLGRGRWLFITGGRFARLCVEIDMKQQLVPKIEVRGKTYCIEYEDLHLICFDYGRNKSPPTPTVGPEAQGNDASGMVDVTIKGSQGHDNMELGQIAIFGARVRMVMEDFNAYLWPYEKFGGGMPNKAFMARFNNCLLNYGLQDLGFKGQSFTWEGRSVKKRLDCVVLINGEPSGEF